MRRFFILVLLCGWILWPVTTFCQVSVLTYHNDNSRSGLNPNETVLTPATVNKSQFGKLYSVALDGSVYAQPLYVANVNVPGFGMRNVLYVATENDSVYAIDANAGIVLWSVSFINPAMGITPIPDTDVGCDDIPSEMGITGTPVIDYSSAAGTGTLYLVAETKENGTWFQKLHALDITTGAEKFGGPVVIQASVPGTGNDNVNGVVSFSSLHENPRAALLLSNGVVYIGFGSHCDRPPYHGWLLAYNSTTLKQTGAFNVTPNAEKGGIWQGGGGIAVDANDPNGMLYFVTGNGIFDVNSGGMDYGDSYLKLSPAAFSVADYFTPYNEATLDSPSNEQEPGSGGVLLLPDQTTGPYPHLMVAAGKQGILYLINRDNMGHFNSSNNLVVQQISGQLGSVYSSPAFWQNNIYYAAVQDHLKTFTLTNGLLSSTPTSQAPTSFGFPGSTPSVSANGSSNGIVWALNNSAWSSNGPTVLHAYNASNVATELYNSNQVLARDNPGAAVKFTVPTVANGNVYVGAQQQVTAYGLLPADYFWMSVSPSTQTVAGSGSVSYTVSVNAMAGSSTVNFKVSGLPSGASASFNPPSVTGSGSSTLTITTTGSTASGIYVLQVSGSSSTRNWVTTTTLSVQSALPGPWGPEEIGSASVVGTATYNASTNIFTVQGAGQAVGGDADAFEFVYQPLSGDGQVIAHVASQQNTGGYAQAGVMIRETLTTGSTEASVLVTPVHGITFETRTCTGCASSSTSGPLVTAPYWVWMLRQGSTFSGFASPDGVHWTFVGSTTINMASSVYVGIAVSANTSAKLNTSAFSNVTVGPPSPNFSLAATPSLTTLHPGGNTTYQVTLNSFAGFADMVTLSANKLPAGVAASFNPSSMVGSSMSVLTLTASGSTPTATSPFTVVGTSSTLTYGASSVMMTGGPLPAPWADQDVGNVYSTGGATYSTSSGTFSVAASSLDIAGTADAFHFVYQPLNGDGQLIGHIANQGNTNNWAKAGVMIRESLNANSRQATMLLTPANGSEFERRTCTGCSLTTASGPKVPAPYWVKVVRQGNLFSGYVSADGANWTLVGSITMTLNESAYVGLAVTSHATALNTSTLDNVQ